jgi:hypothetical protein
VAFAPGILLVSLFLHDKYAGLCVLEDLKIVSAVVIGREDRSRPYWRSSCLVDVVVDA